MSNNSVSSSHNNFAFHLYEKIGRGKDENVFVSPYSIVSALSMCFAGARKNTEQQLKKVLHYLNLSNEDVHKGNALLMKKLGQLPGVTLNVANKLYPNVGFKVEKDFIEILGKHYNSEIQQVDYTKAAEAAKTINDWVALQTKDKIKDLVPESVINDLVRLILVNAIYFKGNWLNKFNKEKTRKEPFHLQDGTSKEVDMMVMLDKKFRLLISPENLKASVCRFPYEGNNLSMTIILPHEGIKINEVEASLNAELLNTILTQPVFEGKVHVYIPKFKFEKSQELSDILKEMGASDAFDEARADFTGINKDPSGLYISKVIHKAVVEVNEEGTEAAAATAVIMMTRCARIEPPPEEFKCDRPFIFLIHDNQDNTVLFLGKYSKP